LWASEGIQSKWEATSQAKKRSARALRATANDYERFQIQLAKKERSAKRAKA
jgi:large subunit ribosomal protein L14e